jgi:hypothetical protein
MTLCVQGIDVRTLVPPSTIRIFGTLVEVLRPIQLVTERDPDGNGFFATLVLDLDEPEETRPSREIIGPSRRTRRKARGAVMKIALRYAVLYIQGDRGPITWEGRGTLDGLARSAQGLWDLFARQNGWSDHIPAEDVEKAHRLLYHLCIQTINTEF